jgi:tRNA 2-thiouridine synthesizing protein E
MQLILDDKIIALDKEGFLKNLSDWNKDVAKEIATRENIALTAEHWEIIELLREFYYTFQISPSMRALVKRTEQQLGADKGRSIYLLQLFPPSPAKLASKISGLPKPPNCF